MVHTRAAAEDTIAALEPLSRHRRAPLLLVAELLAPALERGYYVSFAGNVTYPKAEPTCGRRRARFRRIASWPRRTALTSRRSRGAGGRTSRRTSSTPSRPRRGARRGAPRARRPDRRQRNRRLRAVMSRPAAKKELGQHFLVDENILGVIGRLAELGPEDVVLEVGPGLGVLTRYLAERVRARARGRARPLARGAAARAARRPRQRRAAVRRRAPRSTSPRSTRRRRKLVANLPYNVATPLVVESLDGLPSARALVRDGAARGRGPLLRRAVDEGVRRGLRARPARSRAHRLPPRLAHGLPAAAERRLGARRLSAERAAARLPPASSGVVERGVRAPAEDARRTRSSWRVSRRARTRRRRSRRSAASRPRVPRSSRRPSSSRSRRRSHVSRAPATAKINLALVVGPRRDDGKHEVATVLQRIDLADRVATRAGGGAPRRGLRRGHARRAGARCARRSRRRRAALGGPALRSTIPVAAGLGGGSSDAAAALRLANETLDSRSPAERLHELAAALGADVPFFLTSGPQLGDAATGTELTPLDLPQDYWVVLVLPHGERRRRPRAVYDAFDQRGGADGFDERRAALLDALAPRGARATSPLCRRTTSRRSPLAAELRALGAFRADVSGAGPAVYGLFQHREPAGRRGARSCGPAAAPGSRFRRGTVDRDGLRHVARARRAIEHALEPTAAGCVHGASGSPSGSPSLEGVLVALAHDISRWTVIIVAIAAASRFYSSGGRRSSHDTVRQVDLDRRRLAGARGRRACSGVHPQLARPAHRRRSSRSSPPVPAFRPRLARRLTRAPTADVPRPLRTCRQPDHIRWGVAKW